MECEPQSHRGTERRSRTPILHPGFTVFELSSLCLCASVVRIPDGVGPSWATCEGRAGLIGWSCQVHSSTGVARRSLRLPEFPMKKHYDQHPDPEDMFADTRMTFGEHIEDLRTICCGRSTASWSAWSSRSSSASRCCDFIASPVEQQLKTYWNRYYQEKRAEIVTAAKSGMLRGQALRHAAHRS